MVVSTLLISTGGLIVRLLDTNDPDAINLVRSLALIIAVQLLGHVAYRRNALADAIALGWRGLVGGAILGLAGICYLLALLNTSVAATTLTMSATPLIAALLAYVLLRERVSGSTVAGSVLAAIGIAIMAVPQLQGEGSRFGFLMAVTTACGYAYFAVFLRQNRLRETFPILIWAGAVIALFSVARLDGVPDLSLKDWLLLAFWGGAISAVSNWLMILASRTLQAAEFTLIGLLEYLLAPLWVLIVVSEVPSPLVIAGGMLTFSAVVVSLSARWRKSNGRASRT